MALLKHTIVKRKMARREMFATTVNDKQASLDVICHTSDGRQFIVEMQNNRKTDFCSRLFYYGAKAIQRQVKAGDK